MQDPPELRQVHLAEGLRHGLRESVGDAVRVPDPLSLDDFRALFLDWRVDEFLDEDVPCHGEPPTDVAAWMPRSIYGCCRTPAAWRAERRRGRGRAARSTSNGDQYILAPK